MKKKIIYYSLILVIKNYDIIVAKLIPEAKIYNQNLHKFFQNNHYLYNFNILKNYFFI
jgi:hypothetical protein